MTKATTNNDTKIQSQTTDHKKESAIHLWQPHINNIPITSKPQLHHILHTEYPHLKHHHAYSKLLADAERHLDLITTLHDKTHLQHGDVAALARQLGVTRMVIYYHIKHAERPRLYWLIDHAISTSQAHHHLTQIQETNKGIHSLTDLKTRLHTYYPTQYLEHAPTHHNRLTNATNTSPPLHSSPKVGTATATSPTP